MNNYDESRVSLTLSRYAEQKISDDADMFDFKINGLINLILQNTKKSSKASIKISMDKERRTQEKLLKKHSLSDNADCKKYLEAILEDYEKNLVIKMNKSPKDSGMTRKIRINKANQDLINNKENYYSSRHYKNLSDYIKALVEEYSELPPVKRESTIFSDNYEKAKSYINKLVSITTKSRGKECTFYSQIYDVRPDERYNYNYVITIDPNTKELKSLRLSRITSITLEEEEDDKKTLTIDTEAIEKQIKLMGVPFLSDKEPRKCTIKFTTKGNEMYKEILHLRPKELPKEKGSKDKTTKFFNCSEKQICNYFHRFGSEIKITKPTDLAEKFKKWYKEGYEQYQ